MVRSRSETNLKRIFLELCTSPEVRSKNEYIPNNERQYNPPLPPLKPIKSISCTELTNSSPENIQSSSTDDTEMETLDLMTPLQTPPKESVVCPTFVSIPLSPMESTGFIVQTTCLTDSPVSSFETTLLNSTEKSHKRYSSLPQRSSSLQDTPSNDKKCKTSSLIQTPSNDKTHQDYTNRLRDRLKSRTHLRKFFLS
jgi:hypothetical protein